jgi:hypothetical protein
MAGAAGEIDIELQPTPLPKAPLLNVELARSSSASVAWLSEENEACCETTQWEMEWGFPLMGGW